MSEAMPLVTVVTVTYNSERFVRDAIESVLCQSYKNLELIIGDDASTDDTWQIVQSYTDSRIRAYRNEKNLGEYPNRNKAFQMAHGEYLIYIDGDDMVYPYGIEMIVKMLIAFPDSAMAIMFPFDERFFYPIVLSPREFYLNYFFGKGLLDVAFTNTLFRVKALIEIGGITEDYHAGDVFTRFRIAALYNTLIICDQFTWWRVLPNQASQRLLSNAPLSMSESIEMYNILLNSNACPLSINERKLAQLNIAYSLKMTFLRSVKRFRFIEGYRLALLTKKFQNSFFSFVTLKKRTDLDPFKRHSGENPYKLDLKKNPFSKISTSRENLPTNE